MEGNEAERQREQQMKTSKGILQTGTVNDERQLTRICEKEVITTIRKSSSKGSPFGVPDD
jgi:hypothetical protein